LEHIFRNLSFTEILSVKRVSKHFNDTTNASPRIRKKLWLCPSVIIQNDDDEVVLHLFIAEIGSTMGWQYEVFEDRPQQVRGGHLSLRFTDSSHNIRHRTIPEIFKQMSYINLPEDEKLVTIATTRSRCCAVADDNFCGVDVIREISLPVCHSTT
jgi:hypothetical protein